MESNTSTMLGSLVKNILKYTTSQLVHMEYVDFEMNHICQVEANYWDTFKCHIHYKYSVLFDGKKNKKHWVHITMHFKRNQGKAIQ